MQYFNTQEQAMKMFEQLNEATQVSNKVMITVNNQLEVPLLLTDLSVLLQDKPVEVKRNRLQIKGTKDTPCIKIYVFAVNKKQPAAVKVL